MVNYITNEDGEIIGIYPEEEVQKKTSMFKRMIKGLGNEVKEGHKSMLKKRAERAAMNRKIKDKRKSKYPNRDYNLLHAHERCKIGW